MQGVSSLTGQGLFCSSAAPVQYRNKLSHQMSVKAKYFTEKINL